MSFMFSIFVMRFLESESVLMLSRPVVDDMVLMLLVDSARCLWRARRARDSRGIQALAMSCDDNRISIKTRGD